MLSKSLKNKIASDASGKVHIIDNVLEKCRHDFDVFPGEIVISYSTNVKYIHHEPRVGDVSSSGEMYVCSYMLRFSSRFTKLELPLGCITRIQRQTETSYFNTRQLNEYIIYTSSMMLYKFDFGTETDNAIHRLLITSLKPFAYQYKTHLPVGLPIGEPSRCLDFKDLTGSEHESSETESTSAPSCMGSFEEVHMEGYASYHTVKVPGVSFPANKWEYKLMEAINTPLNARTSPQCSEPIVFQNASRVVDASKTHPNLTFTFDLAGEFIRQGVNDTEIPQVNRWVTSAINSDYELCESYPDVVAFPMDVSEEVIKGSAKFRSQGRFPTLTYRCRGTGRTISRCAQPKSGVLGVSDEFDIKLLNSILKASQSQSLCILDCRPWTNVMACSLAGNGTENPTNYQSTTLRYLNIPNIHAVRHHMEKMCVYAGQEHRKEGKWMDLIATLLDGARQGVQLINQGTCLLVHCSDGWDRTSQIATLVQILIDPFYRTLLGFFTLVEKDWLAFGHRFGERCGCRIDQWRMLGTQESSPIFTQWLACVYQIMIQNPNAFEFNTQLLQILQVHHQSTLFGNFIGNCERERKSAGLSSRTVSIWDFVLQQRDRVINPNFRASQAASKALQFDTKKVQLFPVHETEGPPKEVKEARCQVSTSPFDEEVVVIDTDDCGFTLLPPIEKHQDKNIRETTIAGRVQIINDNHFNMPCSNGK